MKANTGKEANIPIPYKNICYSFKVLIHLIQNINIRNKEIKVYQNKKNIYSNTNNNYPTCNQIYIQRFLIDFFHPWDYDFPLLG